MGTGNCTQVSEFILIGFTDRPEIQAPLFVLFLVIYVITLVGNLGMIMIVRIDSQLRTPMYFFLSNLSLVDFCYSTVITPKMLADLLIERKAISYTACATQICIFSQLDVMECFLLATMAYDRYVAICNPLLFKAVMCPRLCVQLVAGSFLAGCVNAIAQTTVMLTLTFCGSNIIDLFFCDISPLLSLSSSDSSINHIVLLTLASLTGMFTSLIVLISYIFIFNAILRIHSAESKRKAFNTCASHLMAVSIFYGTGLFIYLQPSTKYSRSQDKVVSVFYTVVTPMLNPLIYSLRNKEMKDAMRRVMERKKFSISIN
ncbi:olfactory receptor 5J3-like [Emydura macquarii macquarii]|uniref:olfactory receptor 5J3-like n=1 Tax=Emydura macquarii macquarii TaxID=1129001 RepID=UPI00352AB5BA